LSKLPTPRSTNRECKDVSRRKDEEDASKNKENTPTLNINTTKGTVTSEKGEEHNNTNSKYMPLQDINYL